MPNKVNISTPPIPWLPGATVNYSCVDNYIPIDNRSSTIECEVDKTEKVAKWTDHQYACFPGM